MNKSVSKLRLNTTVVSVYACIVSVLLVASIALFLSEIHTAQKRSSRTREANCFFYTTMHALFEGTYNPEDGSISQRALDAFRKYESRLGGKCVADIGDDSSGYHGGLIFFPSGDIFDVVIIRHGERLVLTEFNHENWGRLWSDSLKWYVKNGEK